MQILLLYVIKIRIVLGAELLYKSQNFIMLCLSEIPDDVRMQLDVPGMYMFFLCLLIKYFCIFNNKCYCFSALQQQGIVLLP
jgi:hypothetical protein